jgi:CxxC motif-containing protein
MPTITEKIICTTCPKGCTLEVNHDGQTVVSVLNNGCKRGIAYAEQELSDPRRMVASSVRVTGTLHPLMPVYTSAPFPKPRIPELLKLLREVEIKAPVTVDQVVIQDALGTGIDIKTSRTMEKIAA